MSQLLWRVRATDRAAEHIRRISAWWRENRLAAIDLFDEELHAAMERLASTPGSGAPHHSEAVPGLRRILLPRSRYHAYYTVDVERREVLVRAIWHTSRSQWHPRR